MGFAWRCFTVINGGTVDGSEIQLTTWDAQSPVNNGINYQPQLVQDFFHQQYVALLVTGKGPPCSTKTNFTY